MADDPPTIDETEEVDAENEGAGRPDHETGAYAEP